MVSGARDYIKEANRAANLVLEKVPEYRNYFSELPNHPNLTMRLAPGQKVPRHLYRPYEPVTSSAHELAVSSSRGVVSGTHRYRYFAKPIILGMYQPTMPIASSSQVGPGWRGDC